MLYFLLLSLTALYVALKVEWREVLFTVNLTEMGREWLWLILYYKNLENGRLTGLVISYVETAFYNELLKER